MTASQLAHEYMGYIKTRQLSPTAEVAKQLLKGNSPLKKEILTVQDKSSGLCILSLAATHGCLDLLPKGAFTAKALDATDKFSRTVIHYASMHNGLEHLRKHLTPARLLQGDEEYKTPVHYICLSNPAKLAELDISLELFLAAGRSNIINPPLFQAAQNNQLHLFPAKYLTRQALLQTGWEKTINPSTHMVEKAVQLSVAHKAAKTGEYSKLPRALANQLLHLQDSTGNTPLHYILGRLGPDSTSDDFPHYLSPEAINKAMKVSNFDGETPLVSAANGFAHIPIEFITDENLAVKPVYGPSTKTSTKNSLSKQTQIPRSTTLTKLAQKKLSNLRISEGLLERQDYNGNAFIHHLAAWGNMPSTESMSEVEVERLTSALQLQDQNGDTPLHYVARYNFAGVQFRLLTMEALTTKNHTGETPIQIWLSKSEIGLTPLDSISQPSPEYAIPSEPQTPQEKRQVDATILKHVISLPAAGALEKALPPVISTFRSKILEAENDTQNVINSFENSGNTVELEI